MVVLSTSSTKLSSSVGPELNSAGEQIEWSLNMKAIWLVLVILITTNLAQAKTLLISDIDDSIKISHVKSPLGMAIRAFSTSSVFMDMPELYQLIKSTTDTEIIYLTTSPAWLMQGSHTRFLKENGFPEGPMILRTTESRENHKITNLRKIIQDKKPTDLILIGDNGERDIEIYDQIQREYPEVKMTTFIRTLYSQKEHSDILKLKPGQKSFLTPAEIALVLAEKSYLPAAQAQEFAANVLRNFNRGIVHLGLGPAFQLAWMDGSDFKWPAQEAFPWNKIRQLEHQLMGSQCRSVFIPTSL